MSKVCVEKRTVANGDTGGARQVSCNRPAMTSYGGRFMCWDCRERYEQQAKELLRASRNPPRR